MPQLSLYIDESTLKRIELLAKIENKSISKWVRLKLRNVIEKTWPEDYFSLFGSVSEDQLERPDDLDIQHGAAREHAMSYFLDTNICIYFLKGMFPKLLESFQKVSPDNIKIASIVKAELLLGAYKSNACVKTEEKVKNFLLPYQIISFDDSCSITYAKIRANLEKSGEIIGANGPILSATVQANNSTLVTNNEAEFNRIKNLKVINWTK